MVRNLTEQWSHNSWTNSTNLDDIFNDVFGVLGEFLPITIVPFHFILGMVVLGSYVIAVLRLRLSRLTLAKRDLQDRHGGR